MIGVYFSGTGNTKYCVEKFITQMNEKVMVYSIENVETISKIKEHSTIVLGYPIYYSNLPKIVRDFIVNNSDLWKNKKVFIIATMGLFSGDGTGLSARLLRKYGAKVIGGLHLKMPDCIGDDKKLKKSISENRKIIKEAEKKINLATTKIKQNIPVREGLGFMSHLAGLFGQRLYFYNKTANYTDKLKINQQRCIGCGKCISLCPMKNLVLKEGCAESTGHCTMCYRCISNCPQKAITLLGKEVYEQCSIEKYLGGGNE